MLRVTLITSLFSVFCFGCSSPPELDEPGVFKGASNAEQETIIGEEPLESREPAKEEEDEGFFGGVNEGTLEGEPGYDGDPFDED